MAGYAAIEKEAKIFTEECLKNDRIDPALFDAYGVKRGLRDKDGKGVLAGITNISRIDAFAQVDGKKVPCEGKLWYRGYNVYDLIRGLRGKRFAFEEAAYLLLMGDLPNREQLKSFSDVLTRCRDLLAEMAEAHPETQFYFFLPPYSMLWWDNVCRSGQGEEYLYARRAAMERLCAFDNVRLYDFQGEEEIVLNLDNYMDPIHFSADVNRWIALEAQSENSEYLVTPDNGEEKLARVEALVREKIPEKMEGLFGEADP